MADGFLLGSGEARLESSEGFLDGSAFSTESGTSFSEIVDQGREVEVEAVDRARNSSPIGGAYFPGILAISSAKF